MAQDSGQNLNQKLAKFCENMTELEKMTSHFSDFYFELMEEADDKSNVWSKLDANITFSFVNASYFWLYLTLKGTDLKEHPIKDEIGRVRKYMQEFMIMKKDAPKLNVDAAKRFIKSALWEPPTQDQQQEHEQQEQSPQQNQQKRQPPQREENTKFTPGRRNNKKRRN